MNKRYMVRVLRECAEEFYREPEWGLKGGIFEERSYREWAVEEVIRKVIFSSNPARDLELMLVDLNKYSSRNQRSAKIFSILCDTAEWALDIINAMKEV